MVLRIVARTILRKSQGEFHSAFCDLLNRKMLDERITPRQIQLFKSITTSSFVPRLANLWQAQPLSSKLKKESPTILTKSHVIFKTEKWMNLMLKVSTTLILSSLLTMVRLWFFAATKREYADVASGGVEWLWLFEFVAGICKAWSSVNDFLNESRNYPIRGIPDDVRRGLSDRTQRMDGQASYGPVSHRASDKLTR